MAVIVLFACAAPSAAPSAAPAHTADVPGFHVVGNDGAVYLTVGLNVNDWLRPKEEAAAVRRFLAVTERLKIDPVEVSFTTEVLDVLSQDAALIAELKRREPTLQEHVRLLEWRKIQGTERELFRTDVSTLALDRSRAGGVVLFQMVFGVTPKSGGSLLGGLLRSTWEAGKETERLTAAGVREVKGDEILVHPDRIIASALDPDRIDENAHVEAYLGVARLQKNLATADVLAAHDSLVRWAQLLRMEGIDVSAVPGISAFVNVSRLRPFVVAFEEVRANSEERSALEAAMGLDAARTRASFVAVGKALAALTPATPAAGISSRLARLERGRSYVARVVWHASNDYTLEPWGINQYGKRGSGLPATNRPASEQAAIARAFDAVLEALRADPRVKIVSLDHDTQWENTPQESWEAIGVAWKDVPSSVDVAAIDAKAAEAGIEAGRKRKRREGR